MSFVPPSMDFKIFQYEHPKDQFSLLHSPLLLPPNPANLTSTQPHSACDHVDTLGCLCQHLF